MPSISHQPNAPVMQPIGPGLVLIDCPPMIMTYVTAVIAHAFGSATKKKFGLPIPKRAVTVCLSGPARFQGVVQQTLSQFAREGMSSPRFLPTTVQQALDWARPEAFQHLVEAMTKPDGSDGLALIAYQDLRGSKAPSAFKDGLTRINAAARNADATFVLITASDDGAATADLADAASDFARLRSHEPDADGGIAFDITWLGIESLQLFGWGHSFVQIKPDDGRYALDVKPFNGTSHQDRLICAGVHAGLPQSDIARDLAISRATVSRRWSDLKMCYPRSDANAWYRKQVERLKAEREQQEEHEK